MNDIVLKVGVKRRRTTKEIADERSEAQLKEQAINQKMAEIASKEKEIKNNASAAEILGNMIKSGVAVHARDCSISIPSAKISKDKST